MSKAYVPPPELAELIGKQVVVDTDAPYIYIGLLDRVGPDFLSLLNVDVHDCTDSRSTKEQYAHEALSVGERFNRAATIVRLPRVVSISKMDDIIRF